MEILGSSHREEQRYYSHSGDTSFPRHVSKLVAEYRAVGDSEPVPTIELRLKDFPGAVVTVCVHQGYESVTNSYNITAPDNVWDQVNTFLKTNLDSLRSYLDQIALLQFDIWADGKRHRPNFDVEAFHVAQYPESKYGTQEH